MFLNDAEELGGVRGANGLALVHHRGVPRQERGVAGVLVAHDPPEVRGSPPSFSRFHSVDRLHRPLVDNGMTSHGVLHPLGLPSGPASVEDVQRLVGLDWHTVVGGGCRHLESVKV